MNRTPRYLLAAIAALLLLPAGAGAALPKPKKQRIVVPESIGGVEVGQRIKDADKAWGGTGECDHDRGFKSCLYESGDELKGRARIDAAAHKRVSSLEITAGRDDDGEYVFAGRLLRFRTKEGIGLGDKGGKVRKAYHDAIRTAGRTGYLIEGKGKSYMTIQTLGGKRITGITLVDGVHQG